MKSGSSFISKIYIYVFISKLRYIYVFISKLRYVYEWIYSKENLTASLNKNKRNLVKLRSK